MIPYEDLRVVNQPYHRLFAERFEEILHRGQYILGSEVLSFEKEFSAYCGALHGVGVGNGYDGLLLMIKSIASPPGAEVIVPSNTHIATVLAVIGAGLRPVLVEPDICTYTLDPQRTREAVTRNTVAILAVHLYGRCAPMPELLAIAKENQLTLLEDCAQAHGASVDGRMAGTWGAAGAFSFYPTKNLGALGDGGFITTSDQGIFDRCLMMRNYGAKMKDVHEVGGVNSRLDEIQAAVLRVKLKHLDEINAHRHRLAMIYDAGLKSDFIRPVRQEGYVDVHHIYPIRHHERDRLRDHLDKKGIGTMIHYPTPLHRQKSLRGIVQDHGYPVAEEISNTILSLPISTAHRPEDIERVVGALNSF